MFGFVVLGRRTHDEAETFAGILRTAAPFMLGLAAAWIGVRAWRRPVALTTGAWVWLITVLVGMALRRVVFLEGIAAAFIVVGGGFLALGFLGWRLATSAVTARRTRPS